MLHRARWLRALDSLLALIYPTFCAICGAFVPESRDASVCRDCWDDVCPIQDPVCDICGLPLPPSVRALTPAPRCGDCLFDTYSFTAARAAVQYERTLREIIHLFKFNRRRNLAGPLSDLLYHTYEKERGLFAVDFVTAVPLHTERLRERGFNQSALLAGRLAHRAGLRFLPEALARRRATASQSGLNKKARSQNVRRAFTAPKPHAVKDRSVLLIDDVFTTGATLSECARTLKEAGARSVYVLTVARVVS